MKHVKSSIADEKMIRMVLLGRMSPDCIGKYATCLLCPANIRCFYGIGELLFLTIKENFIGNKE